MTMPARTRRLPRVPLTPFVVVIGLVLIALYVDSQPARLGDDQIINQRFLQERFEQHLKIVAVSFGISALIGLTLGVLLAQARWFVRVPVFFVTNVGQAFPSVALLAFIFTYTGLGFTPTVIALVLYALLPIVRNTMVGLTTIDPAVVEAARGMGMTRLQTLLRVEIPLALPVIFAGLRTALVLVVGTATLANFIGGGGLGDVISAGIGAGRNRIVITGTGIVAALALLLDFAFGALQRLLTPET
jgi:osmoprotectant transport system permease protein